MKEIVERLQENRNIERAKQILESNGYKVTKKSKKTMKSRANSSYNESLEPVSSWYGMNDSDDAFNKGIQMICDYLGVDTNNLYSVGIDDDDKSLHRKIVSVFKGANIVDSLRDREIGNYDFLKTSSGIKGVRDMDDMSAYYFTKDALR